VDEWHAVKCLAQPFPASAGGSQLAQLGVFEWKQVCRGTRITRRGRI
jgi:hypothetical protein